MPRVVDIQLENGQVTLALEADKLAPDAEVGPMTEITTTTDTMIIVAAADEEAI